MQHKQYTKNQVEEIKQKADLLDIVESEIKLKKSGSNLIGDCPRCNKKKKFSVNTAKQIYKCFVCDKDFAGNNAVNFLMQLKDISYVEALAELADRYNIYIEKASENIGTTKRTGKLTSFRDMQLKLSGIKEAAQRYKIRTTASEEVELDRYTAGSLDKYNKIIDGDDMLLHYLNLDGKPITYYPPKTKKPEALVRIRYKNPKLHLDKKGRPIKYKSPYKSGSHLWLPQLLIGEYNRCMKDHTRSVETLYVCEGEKKADVLCSIGMYATAIMGISNLSEQTAMPHQFDLLTKSLNVKNIVFLLDNDLFELSSTTSKSVDQRSNQFFKAVLNFRDYFYAYNNQGTSFNIFFGYTRNENHKGVDDLLVNNFKNSEQNFKEDVEKTLISRSGNGKHIVLKNITEMSSYNLKKFWSLDNKNHFFSTHKDQLKKLEKFKYAGVLYKYNESNDEFEVAQKMLPHEQFWIDSFDKNNKRRIEFDYLNVNTFLKNRGYGLYEFQGDNTRFIKVDTKKVEEVKHKKIKNDIKNFIYNQDDKDLARFLLKGLDQYFGPSKLENMHDMHLQFAESDPNCEYMFFPEYFWKITPTEIKQLSYEHLDGYVWEDKIKDFSPKIIEDFFDITIDGQDWNLKASAALAKSEAFQYLNNTSDFLWRKTHRETTNEQGNICFEKLPQSEWQDITTEEVMDCKKNLITKLLAIGYMASGYDDPSNKKAVIGMDGAESEVGESKGRSGKSVFGILLENLTNVFDINGKKKKIFEDKHRYEGVDERTNTIFYDDIPMGFDFEQLYSELTKGIEVNPKGQSAYKVYGIKFYITTNHAFSKINDSSIARQYPIVFSDYYNLHRSPKDEFGHLLFNDWDFEQWNLFYNLAAKCIQFYLQNPELEKMKVEGEKIKKRNLRQIMREEFLTWATLFYNKESGRLNQKIEKNALLEDFLKQNESSKRYVDHKQLKKKLVAFCDYMGYTFNPAAISKDREGNFANGGRISSGSSEYYCIADKDFSASRSKNYKAISDIKELDDEPF